MAASITDYFKPKNSKKRKHDEIENDEQVDDQLIEPSKKRKRTIQLNETSDETKEESDCEEEEDDDIKPPDKVSYANMDALIPSSWRPHLKKQFGKVYFKNLRKKLEEEHQKGKEIFPPLEMTFKAFDLTPWDNLKCVIVGQDPYHDDHQAEGLCFSVQKGIKIPSSLRNMFKEAANDDGLSPRFKKPSHGSLVKWGEQGVLLLNTVLTVEAHKPNSHKKFGWQEFTDAVIKSISDNHDGVVFILWGGQAKKKKKIINTFKHKIVESAHPSGLSASRGFFGSKPYSKTNACLKQLGKSEINWQIDD